MLMCRLAIVSLFFLNNDIMGMEEVSFKDKVKSFDEARSIASSQPCEWKNYDFSSRLIVEIIKKRRLLISDDPTQEEVVIIKNMKKQERQQYDQLIGQLRNVLRCTVNETERMRAQQWNVDWCYCKDKTEELNSMERAIIRFEHYDRKYYKFWKLKPCSYAHLLSVLLMTEFMLFAVCGMIDVVCYMR